MNRLDFSGRLSIVILSAVSLQIGGFVARAQDVGPREIREIVSGWRFQVDVGDVGEHESWYDAGFDRSSWARPRYPERGTSSMRQCAAMRGSAGMP